MRIGGKAKLHRFIVANIKDDVILGYDWFKATEPDISWKRGIVRIEEEQYFQKYHTDNDIVIRYLQNGTNIDSTVGKQVNPAMRFAQEAEKHAKREEIPARYKEFDQLFDKKSSERFPERMVYDHAIDL
ncbi:hypothetical protein NEOLEDRAFT_1071728, partial [Neolentinus lepideus HHB14362 ss-1]